MSTSLIRPINSSNTTVPDTTGPELANKPITASTSEISNAVVVSVPRSRPNSQLTEEPTAIAATLSEAIRKSASATGAHVRLDAQRVRDLLGEDE